MQKGKNTFTTFAAPYRSGLKIQTSAKLIKLTFPIAVSEVLWGASSFIYALVFIRLGTSALAASQIVMTIENIFIVAVSGLSLPQ